MIDLEKLSAIALQLISYGGCAKSMYVEALNLAKKNEFEKADAKIAEADNMIANAHKLHLELLQMEAEENMPQVSLLIVHAEDQIMNCETIKIMVLESKKKNYHVFSKKVLRVVMVALEKYQRELDYLFVKIYVKN